MRNAARDRRAAAQDGGAGAAASAAAQAALGAYLEACLRARRGTAVLAGYLPIGTEIDPVPVMARFAARLPVCVPVVAAPGTPLAFRGWRPGCALVRGRFGVAVPADGAALSPDLLIVPLLAFDRAGRRLGYGGGYYDRTLAALRARGPVIAVGLAFAAQEVPEVPHGSLDAPLDGVVTEAGMVAPG